MMRCRVHLVLVALLHASLAAKIKGAQPCQGQEHGGKSVGVSVAAVSRKGVQVTIEMACGEDVAQATARVATHKRTTITDKNELVRAAASLQDAFEKEASAGRIVYTPPDRLDAGGSAERPRQLKTGGMYSRRAMEHATKEEFRDAVADFLRALLRPKLDETARAKLTSMLEEVLANADKKRAKTAADGDLAELFEAFDMEDDPTGDGEFDRAKLKRMYRELSVKYHPDKNSEAKVRFNEVRDAYEILSDPVKTLLFDTAGMEQVRKFEGNRNDLEKTENVDKDVYLNLEDVYTGTQVTISNQRRVVCRGCKLNPQYPRCTACKRCPGEKGQKQVWLDSNRYRIEEYETPSEHFCKQEDQKIEVSIDKGMMAGDRVLNPHMASQLPKRVPGDVNVNIRVRPHRSFARVGNDLILPMNVSLSEALLGFEREMKHLDGHRVKFSVPRGAVVKPDSGIFIEDEGMPFREDPSSFGRLLVKFTVVFPTSIDVEKSAALEAALTALGVSGETHEDRDRRRRGGEL